MKSNTLIIINIVTLYQMFDSIFWFANFKISSKHILAVIMCCMGLFSIYLWYWKLSSTKKSSARWRWLDVSWLNFLQSYLQSNIPNNDPHTDISNDILKRGRKWKYQWSSYHWYSCSRMSAIFFWGAMQHELHCCIICQIHRVCRS